MRHIAQSASDFSAPCVDLTMLGRSIHAFASLAICQWSARDSFNTGCVLHVHHVRELTHDAPMLLGVFIAADDTMLRWDRASERTARISGGDTPLECYDAVVNGKLLRLTSCIELSTDHLIRCAVANLTMFATASRRG
jgi:hypothetical protein